MGRIIVLIFLSFYNTKKKLFLTQSIGSDILTKVSLYLLCISFIILRLVNIQDFKIYKDSFKLLFISKATANLSTVANFYPNYEDFANTNILTPYKWLFGYVNGFVVKGLTIVGIEANNQTFETVMHMGVILFGLLTALLTFKVIINATRSRKAALLSVAFITISGIHLIWSGLIITDTFASFVILLYVYFRLYKSLVVVNLITWFALYITRPELVVIPIVIEILLKGIKIAKLKSVNTLIFKLNTALFTSILIFSTYNSDLISRNINADYSLWVGLLVTLLILLTVPNKFLNLNEGTLKLLNVILIVSSTLLVVYYWFNPEISRYIVTFIPFFAILTGVGFITFVNLLRFSRVQYLFLALIGLSLILNVVNYLSFGKLESPEYHTEIATVVLDYAAQNSIKTIYVGQEEAYIWEDQKNSLNIYNLSRLDLNHLSSNTIIVNDTSIPYVSSNIDGVNLTDFGFELNKSFNTNAPFRVNNIISNGFVEIWVKN